MCCSLYYTIRRTVHCVQVSAAHYIILYLSIKKRKRKPRPTRSKGRATQIQGTHPCPGAWICKVRIISLTTSYTESDFTPPPLPALFSVISENHNDLSHNLSLGPIRMSEAFKHIMMMSILRYNLINRQAFGTKPWCPCSAWTWMFVLKWNMDVNFLGMWMYLFITLKTPKCLATPKSAFGVASATKIIAQREPGLQSFDLPCMKSCFQT